MQTVQRSWIRTAFELGALMLVVASGVKAVASAAAVSGVVRDTRGVAQMGATVEVLGVASARTAYTDMNGRYRIENLMPGRYAVRASAALFVPAMRENLRLATGMRATVNLTLNTLSDPTVWLPAERRKIDAPGDDWTWTLRSAANRPILRVMGDGSVVLASADRPHGARVKAQVLLSGGYGGFGEGGVRSVVTLDRATRDGSDGMLRIGIAGAGSAAATEIAAGYGQQSGLGRESRMVVSYASHPEMMSSESAGGAGLQTMRMASAEKIQLGDTVEVEAGGAVNAIHTAGFVTAGSASMETTLVAQPFVRVTVQPFAGWSVAYRMATARELQGFDGLDSIATDTPVATACGAKLCTEGGMHQEIGVSRRAGGGLIEAAIYRDQIGRTAIAGAGAMSAADLAGSDAVVDTVTGSFRFLSAGYTANGVRFTLSEPLNAHLWAELEYESGAAMAAERAEADGVPQLHAESASSATVALRGRDLRTGTSLRAVYRWQPRHLVTAVGPYADYGDPAFLSFEVHQAVRCGGLLPSGFEATINVTNLLAQGYQPFLSTDGRTLYLAQTPRTIQGGLSFTF